MLCFFVFLHEILCLKNSRKKREKPEKTVAIMRVLRYNKLVY